LKKIRTINLLPLSTAKFYVKKAKVALFFVALWLQFRNDDR